MRITRVNWVYEFIFFNTFFVHIFIYILDMETVVDVNFVFMDSKMRNRFKDSVRKNINERLSDCGA